MPCCIATPRLTSTGPRARVILTEMHESSRRLVLTWFFLSVSVAACGGDAGSDPVTPPEDRTSAAICGEDFSDVAAAWANFSPAVTIAVCGSGCDATTLEDGVALGCDGASGDVDVAVSPGIYSEALYLACPGARLRLRAATPPASGEALAALPEADRVVLDGAFRAADACGGEEHGALQIEAARAVWIEGLEIRDYRRACAKGTAYGVVVQGDGGLEAVRVRANYIHDLGVACAGGKATCDGDLNGHGVLVVGVDDQPIRAVEVAGNLLTGLSLGQSEALALNGHVERFVVADNVIRDVDNIGIDIIGFENDLPWQAREGLVRDNVVEDLRCGNPTYASDTENDPCPAGPGRWPAAAAIYLDGAHGVCVANNRTRGFDRGLEVASERGGGARQASAIALCGNRLEASREHAMTYGGSCGGGSNGARDVRLVDNTTVCPAGDAARREIDRDPACTTPLLCGAGAGCDGPAPDGEPLQCP